MISEVVNGNFLVGGLFTGCFGDKAPDSLNGFYNRVAEGYFCFHTSGPYQYIKRMFSGIRSVINVININKNINDLFEKIVIVIAQERMHQLKCAGQFGFSGRNMCIVIDEIDKGHVRRDMV